MAGSYRTFRVHECHGQIVISRDLQLLLVPTEGGLMDGPEVPDMPALLDTHPDAARFDTREEARAFIVGVMRAATEFERHARRLA